MIKRQISAAVFITLAMSSCATHTASNVPTGTPNIGQQSPKNDIFGIVNLDGPVANADVKAFDAAGALIGIAKTSDRGGFVIDTTTPPENYNIVVKGGTSNGLAVDGTLRSEIGPGINTLSIVSVNPATTLVSLARKKNTTLSLNDATQKVKRFLNLQEDTDLSWNLDKPQFSGTKFSTEAINVGGQDAFFTVLLNQMNSGQTHSFSVAVLKGTLGDLVSFATKNIAEGFFSSAGDAVFGGFMSLIGLGGDGDAAAREAEAREMKKLNELSDQINSLKDSVNNLELSLNSAINKSTYIALSGGKAATYIGYNQVIANKLKVLAAISEKDVVGRKSALDDLDKYIYQNLVFSDVMTEWNIVMVGSNAGALNDGLIANWSKLIAQTDNTKYGIEQAKAIQNQWDYYQGQQAQSMIYIINYLKYHKTDNDAIIQQIKNWQEEHLEQLSMLKGGTNAVDHFYIPGTSGPVDVATPAAALPQNTVIDRVSNTMWTTEPVFSGTIRSVEEANNGILNFRTITEQKSAALKSSTQLDGWQLPEAPERTISHIHNGNPDFNNKKAIFVPSENYGKRMHELNINFDSNDRILYNEAPEDRRVQLIASASDQSFSSDDRKQIANIVAYWDNGYLNFNSRCTLSQDKYTPLIMNKDHGQFIINNIKDQGNNHYYLADGYCVRIFDDGILDTYELATSGDFQTEGQFLDREVKIFLKRSSKETYWYQ